MRKHLNGVNAIGNGDAHHFVNRANFQQILWNAVICAETDAAAVLGRDQRQQRVQIVGIGGFADQDIEAAGQLFGGFGDGDTFMFGADARGDIGIEGAPA